MLLIVDASRPSAQLTQVRLLAPRLTDRGFEPHVCGLGGEPVVAGAHSIHRRWTVDPVAAWETRRLATRLGARVVHAWGIDGTRHAAAAVRGRGKVFTLDRPPEETPWLGSKPDAVVVPGPRLVGLATGAREVTPPGVETSAPATSGASREELRAEVFGELGLPAEAKVIAIVSRMLPRKGVRELLWAADLVRVLCDDVRFLVIGDGPQLPANVRFARMASDLEHLRFLGERGDVPRLLAAADLCWHAGDELSAPVAVLEAMAAGLPVVADDTPGAREAITDGETGVLVAPGARAQRARVTDRLLGEGAERRRLGDAARASVRERFDADRMADAYAGLYRRLLG